MNAHFFIPTNISNNAQRALLALASSANSFGINTHVTRGGIPTTQGDVLVTYGAGGDLQRAAINHYRGSGLRTVCLDLGYWNRTIQGNPRCFRFAVDSRHPQQSQVGRATPCQHTVTSQRVRLIRDAYDPRGHYLFAKMGAKSVRAFPDAVRREGELLKAAQAAFGSALVVREKTKLAESQPIDHVLQACAGVITYSSNVALDAALFRIPSFSIEGVTAPFSSPLGNMRRLSSETAETIIRKAGAFHVSLDECKTAAAWRKVNEVLSCPA